MPSACELLYLRAADQQKHLFGPDESELQARTDALVQALRTASTDVRPQLLLKLADAHTFRVRAFTRACHQFVKDDDSRARDASSRAHAARRDLAGALVEALATPQQKEPLLLLRLGLVHLHLAQFSDAAESFGHILRHEHPGRSRPLAAVGHSLALRRMGSENAEPGEAVAPPVATSSGADPTFVAFAATQCLKGEWAEERGQMAEARRAYDAFVTWADLAPKVAAENDARFSRHIRLRLEGLAATPP